MEPGAAAGLKATICIIEFGVGKMTRGERSYVPKLLFHKRQKKSIHTNLYSKTIQVGTP